MKKTLLIPCLLILLFSCGIKDKIKNKYFTDIDPVGRENMKKDPDLQIGQIILDSSYKLYVRQICRKSPPEGYYYSQNPIETASVVRCNCEEMEVPRKQKERLEIEYLLVSVAKKRFVYMTTVPPSVVPGTVGLVSFYDQPLFDIENMVNINYLNTFFFGELKDDHMILRKGGNIADSKWAYTLEPGKVLHVVNLSFQDSKKKYNSNTSEAFPSDVRFYYKPDWRMILDDCSWDNTIVSEDNNYLENNAIYIVSEKSEPDKVYRVWFHFNEYFNGTPPPEYFDLYFDNGRVKSSPFNSSNQLDW
jgi:hypothetical protein